MRIIAGEFKSRRLLSPPEDWAVRPITDRVKESVFSQLRGHCEGAAWFDAFAGSGAIGLEAVSRGAARCVFIEKDRGVSEMLRANVAALKAEDRCEVVTGDALGAGALARCPRPCTVVFLDPPYPLVNEPVGWGRVRDHASRLAECLADDGFLLIRTPWPFTHTTPSEEAKPVELGVAGAVGPETHVYGSMAVHFYARAK
ncbi:MAG: RsmD family RNA methyltransferase [Phycisphaerales bacterium]